MKGKKRYRKGKGIRKRREISSIMWVIQEIRKQLNRLQDAVGKWDFRFRVSSFQLIPLYIEIEINNKIILSFNNDY